MLSGVIWSPLPSRFCMNSYHFYQTGFNFTSLLNYTFSIYPGLKYRFSKNLKKKIGPLAFALALNPKPKYWDLRRGPVELHGGQV